MVWQAIVLWDRGATCDRVTHTHGEAATAWGIFDGFSGDRRLVELVGGEAISAFRPPTRRDRASDSLFCSQVRANMQEASSRTTSIVW
jgi:hypothetical protein